MPIRTQIVSRPLARTPKTQVPYVPRPRPYQPLPVRHSSPPSASPVRQYQPDTNKVSQPSNLPAPEKKINRLEEWTKISRLGSYGSSTIATSTDEQPSLSTVDTTEVQKYKPLIQKAILVSAVQPSPIPNSDELEPLYCEEAAIIGSK